MNYGNLETDKLTCSIVKFQITGIDARNNKNVNNRHVRNDTQSNYVKSLRYNSFKLPLP